MNEAFLYNYRALVTEVYDADTITVDIDCGLNVWIKDQKIRLFGINAFEVRGDERKEGLVGRDWLREQILGKEIVLKTTKDKKGKYGRYLGVIHLEGRSINNELVTLGHADEVNY